MAPTTSSKSIRRRRLILRLVGLTTATEEIVVRGGINVT
jgi:hypothetical protein